MTTDLPPLEPRAGWGGATIGVAHVVHARTTDDVVGAFALARAHRTTLIPWGAGRSYGDAPLNDGGIVLDLSGMAGILAWDAATGVVTVQPGVTLQQLWQRILPDGWWPSVVSGTMTTTVGGCVAANVHGKNNYKRGPIGDHVLAFTLVTPDGERREVTRESDPNLFHAAIGGFGLLGVFTSITLQTKRVHSGRVDVQPEALGDLEAMFSAFERYNRQHWDYVVGWIDAFPRGVSLGRGQIHAARYLPAGSDPEGAAMMSPESQHLPATILGFPKKWMWRLMKPWAHRLGVRLVNAARYTMSSLERRQHRHLQTHAEFNFLLDYVPDWKRIYDPYGLIQVQLFLPKERAREVMRQALELQQAMGLESWLVVMKRHRRDAFWLSHAVDGYSFAMDFPVRPRRREDLYRMGRTLERMVVDAGGRFYLAKDSLVSPEGFARSLGPEILGRFLALKADLDPEGLIGGSQWRRVIGRVQGVEPLPLAEGEIFAVEAQIVEEAEAEVEAEPEVGDLDDEISAAGPEAEALAPEADSADEAAPGPGRQLADFDESDEDPTTAEVFADDLDAVDDPEAADDDPEAADDDPDSVDGSRST